MTTYKLQHMGLGGILDQAISICKDHFGVLFKIMLILYVPFAAIFGLIIATLAPQGVELQAENFPPPGERETTQQSLCWRYSS